METYYQVTLDNLLGYSKSYYGATILQNDLYKRTKKVGKIRPLKKSQIPIKDWELVNELNQNVKVAISIQ